MNLASIIEGHPDDAPALVSGERRLSYGALRSEVAALRGGLAGLGLGPGDRVAVLAANDWSFVVGYLAVLGSGAVAVPLNPESPSMEIAAELEAVGTRAALVGEAAAAAFAAAVRPATLETVVAGPGVSLEGSVAWADVATAGPAPVADRAGDDLAVLIFTAGTSGPPRAAMLSHANLVANLDQMQRHRGQAVRPGDVSLGVLPLFHIFGLNVVLDLALYAGAAVVLLPRFDPAAALDAVRAHRVTVVAGAPPMFRSWLSLPAAGEEGVHRDAMASVRLVISGAAALPPELASAFEDRFGLPLHQGYGLTEASPTVTSSVTDGPPRPGSIGLPLPGVEVRLVDHDGHDALHGDPGEVWVRGPNVFQGYWPGAGPVPRVVTEEGWLRTGDVAVVDDDGHLYLVDRAKDLIIVSGFNVYPAEVEQALARHEGVSGVAVVGAPHPHSGETVLAFVTAAPGHQPEPAELIEFCARRLARYKCPTRVTVVPELPRGMGGKLLRRALQG